jgi:hypothetical protein
MRKLVMVLLGAALVALPAGPALARGPIIEPAPAGDALFPAGQFCDFPVMLEVLVNRERTITFLNDQGGLERQLIVGAFSYRLTNVTTETSREFTIPGPGTFTPNPDGSLTLVARGPWIFFDPFGTHIYNAGRVVVIGTPDPTSGLLRLDIQSIVGHSFDVCELLA